MFTVKYTYKNTLDIKSTEDSLNSVTVLLKYTVVAYGIRIYLAILLNQQWRKIWPKYLTYRVALILPVSVISAFLESIGIGNWKKNEP